MEKIYLLFLQVIPSRYIADGQLHVPVVPSQTAPVTKHSMSARQLSPFSFSVTKSLQHHWYIPTDFYCKRHLAIILLYSITSEIFFQKEKKNEKFIGKILTFLNIFAKNIHLLKIYIVGTC